MVFMVKRMAYVFRLEPKPPQVAQMARTAGCCRFVFNRGLALEKEAYAECCGLLGYVNMASLLPIWKADPETTFLAEVPAQALQQSLKDLYKGYANLFAKRASFPRFKRKGVHDAFRLPQGFKLDQGNSRVSLPKIGWVRYRKSREVEGVPKNVTVFRKCGHWYMAVQTEQDVEITAHPHIDSPVGIDMGVAKIATLSDGTAIESVNAMRRFAAKLKNAQRRLRRMKKFSGRWCKQQAKVARIHYKIACVRNDALNKATTTIAKNHGIVVVEALKVKNMNKSARGTVENPGRNVRQKAGLNRSILDQGWYEFKRQLGYKLAWRGGKLVEVPAPFTSQRCSVCGHTEAANRPSQAVFRCMACGHTENADLNAAKNILAAGQAVMARGGEETQVAPLKREPAYGVAA